ncbi:hypothetical protein ABAC460_22585 [Asticcacaulis sp. AC460]|uniref:hypothetical protein n=1 Tax=Asticcacaulis sp. AC460 TaxID=1282360 RepID=UPI0003C4094E|nr:hypothetical protein [Asticcacaulis sp. AC460]ESQ86717.1 hypothetical protein ABAC460_22585 [Asticcacaulis sp. AC460]
MNEDQYRLIFNRRGAQNQLLWQVPTICTASEALLLTTAFNPLTTPTTALIFSIFALLVSFSAIHLMTKHRHLEVADSHALIDFEKSNSDKGYSVVHGNYKNTGWAPGNGFAKLSAFWMWMIVLLGFLGVSTYAVYISAERTFSPTRLEGKSSISIQFN